MKRDGHARVPAQWREDDYQLGAWVNTQRTRFVQRTLEPERRAQLEAVPGWTWDVREALWEEGFAKLESFVEREGQARVPRKYRDAGGYRLGDWVITQRHVFQQGTLEPERCARLDAVPGWTWDTREAAWEVGYADLVAFLEREGHTRIPRKYQDADGYRLGSWVNNLRALYQEGTLEPERRAQLEAVPGWTWAPHHDAWEKGFDKLESFVEREGHARVPAQWREGDFRLGQWVTVQRSGFHRGTLERERRARLEAVPGWTWEAREAAWEEGFAKLESFVERDGHARVPAQWHEDGYPLGQWVTNQRARAQVNTDHARRLEALSGWTWEAREAAWEEGFAKLESFVERDGHARVPAQWHEDGYPLGQWVTNQRARAQVNTDHARRLEALSGWTWEAREAAWEEGFAKLESFVEREGHARVPQQWREDGYRLGAWVSNQRNRKSTLGPERRTRLEALSRWAWDARQRSRAR